jgi:ubiquinone/menaquinone biosynthesis C-methylase UbiE
MQLKAFWDMIQAFHWCTDYDAAMTEFARILNPNGVLALIWNLEDRCVDYHLQYLFLPHAGGFGT